MSAISTQTQLTFKYGQLEKLLNADGTVKTNGLSNDFKTGDIYIATHAETNTGSLLMKNNNGLMPITIMPGASGAVLVGNGLNYSPTYSNEVSHLGFGGDPVKQSNNIAYSITTYNKSLFQNDLIFQVASATESGDIIFKHGDNTRLTVGFSADKKAGLITSEVLELRFANAETSPTQFIDAVIKPNIFYNGDYENTSTKAKVSYSVTPEQFKYTIDNSEVEDVETVSSLTFNQNELIVQAKDIRVIAQDNPGRANEEVFNITYTQHNATGTAVSWYNPISFISIKPTSTTGIYGHATRIGSGGPLIIGGGESAQNFFDTLKIAAGTSWTFPNVDEQTYITSDKAVYFKTQCGTTTQVSNFEGIEGRKAYQIDTAKMRNVTITNGTICVENNWGYGQFDPNTTGKNTLSSPEVGQVFFRIIE